MLHENGTIRAVLSAIAALRIRRDCAIARSEVSSEGGGFPRLPFSAGHCNQKPAHQRRHVVVSGREDRLESASSPAWSLAEQFSRD